MGAAIILTREESKSYLSLELTVTTNFPSTSPSVNPTKVPSPMPTKSPTPGPTKSPTPSPTKSPTSSPTKSPTSPPTSDKYIFLGFTSFAQQCKLENQNDVRNAA